MGKWPHKERPLTRLRFSVRGSARRSQVEVRCLSHSQKPFEEGDKGIGASGLGVLRCLVTSGENTVTSYLLDDMTEEMELNGSNT